MLAFLAIVIGHVRDTLQTARALGDVLRVLLAISLGVEVLSGALLDMPLRFLGVQGNIAQLGPIQGIFGTRNLLGFVAVLALITFLIEYRTQSVRPGVSIASVILAGGLAALSDSPTVFVLAVGVGIAVGALALVRHTSPERRAALQWALGALVVIAGIVGYSARHPIIAWIGAGTDFSMRVDLWNEMVEILRFRPVQGWGWFGPWNPREFPFNYLNFRLDASHATGLNAYFDVLLQLGWIGLVLFVALAGRRTRALVAGCLGATIGDLRVDAAHAHRHPHRLDVRELRAVGHRVASAGPAARCGRASRGRGASAWRAPRRRTSRTIRLGPIPQGRIHRPCPSQQTAPR